MIALITDNAKLIAVTSLSFPCPGINKAVCKKLAGSEKHSQNGSAATGMTYFTTIPEIAPVQGPQSCTGQG